jgi:hypothetical protein
VPEAVQAGKCPDYCQVVAIPLLDLPVPLLRKIPVPNAAPAVEAGATDLAPHQGRVSDHPVVKVPRPVVGSLASLAVLELAPVRAPIHSTEVSCPSLCLSCSGRRLRLGRTVSCRHPNQLSSI